MSLVGRLTLTFRSLLFHDISLLLIDSVRLLWLAITGVGSLASQIVLVLPFSAILKQNGKPFCTTRYDKQYSAMWPCFYQRDHSCSAAWYMLLDAWWRPLPRVKREKIKQTACTWYNTPGQKRTICANPKLQITYNLLSTIRVLGTRHVEWSTRTGFLCPVDGGFAQTVRIVRFLCYGATRHDAGPCSQKNGPSCARLLLVSAYIVVWKRTPCSKGNSM